MNARGIRSYEAGLETRATFRQRAWQIATWLLLLTLITVPVFAAPLSQGPTPAGELDNGEQDETFDEYSRPNGEEPPVDLGPPPLIVDEVQWAVPNVASVPLAFQALFGLSAIPAGDLPGYDEEAIALFDVDNAYEIVRHLSVDIGPRVSSTPQEMEAAEYLADLLQSYGFEVTIQFFSRTTTLYVARVTSPDTELPGGPKWQMRASSSAKITGDSESIQAEVIYAGSGQSESDFPPETAGKIVVMNYSSNATTRNTAVVNAVTRGAVGVILVQTGPNSAPPGNFTLTTPQPDVPVVGGGSAHRLWLEELLAAGPLTLTIVTNRYVNMPGVNIVGVKRAVDDPEGTTAPIVMVGGHIDSVLGGPGANDNATAPAAALEMARVIGRYSFDKEIRIVGWGGEEAGLRGSRAYVNALSAEERARFVGYWNMDMMATPYTEAGSGLWAHTTNGLPNYVTQSAYDAAARIGFTNIDGCRDEGGSDHASFSDVGIPSAFFIWEAHYKPAPPDTCATRDGTYSSEPQYHRPSDTMSNVSPERLEIVVQVVGDAVFHSALNAVTLSAAAGTPVSGAAIQADCGDGRRYLGQTGSSGILDTVIPHATCDFTATMGLALSTLDDVAIAGDASLTFPAFHLPEPVLLHGYVDPAHGTIGADWESCGDLDTGSVGAKTVFCIDGEGHTSGVNYNVAYDFTGFDRPIENPPALNVANAGRAIPLIWRLTDANGAPVTSDVHATLTVNGFSCPAGATLDQAEEHAPGASGLQNLGDGYYQFNWATPKSYAQSCKTLMLDLGEGPGLERIALFQFTR